MRLKLAIFVLAYAIGVGMHFLYVPLGRPRALAPLLPVSESPWEHYKLAFWPLCGAMAACAALTGAGWRSWAVASACACAHAFATMFGLFYFYFSALGVGRALLPADVGGYFVTMACAYALGLRVLAQGRPLPAALLSLALLLACAAALRRWSFCPPPLPLFRSGR